MAGLTDGRYAIVGIGGMFPGAENTSRFWENILEKRVSIERLPPDCVEREVYYRPEVLDQSVKSDRSYTDLLATIKDIPFDPRRFRIPPAAAAQMDGTQKLSLLAAEEAISHGGLASVSNERVSVFMGNSMIGQLHHDHKTRFDCDAYEHYLKKHDLFAAVPRDAQARLLADVRHRITGGAGMVTEDTAPGILPNIVAARICSVFDLHGHAYVIDAACASGLAAIICGVQQLALGEADAVVCGASDWQNKEVGRIYFSGIGALSPDGSFPFDARANGFVVGDGAGAVVIKRLEDAQSAGDRVFAVIVGYGQASDGKGKAIAAPNATWQARVIKRAWEQAGCDPETIGLIEAHGTATKVGDVSEVTALKQAFDALGVTARQFCGLGSVKSNIGHLKSAAGIAGFIKAVMAVDQSVLPPSAGFEEENPALGLSGSPFFIVTDARSWPDTGHPRRAGVSAFGFGGADYHIALEAYREEDYTGRRASAAGVRAAAQTAPRGGAFEGPAPLFFSGEDGAAVIDALRRCAADLRRRPELASERITAQNLTASPRASVRLALLYRTVSELWEQLEQVQHWIGRPEGGEALRLKGIAYGEGAPCRAEEIALMFPGQGSQYPDMLASLFERYGAAHRLLASADAIWRQLTGLSVSELLDSSSRGEAATDALLRDTRHTHPVMVTTGLALHRLLREVGLEPAVHIGHSVGELTALAAAERLCFSDALTMVHARAAAFDAVPPAARGAMAALRVDEAGASGLIRSLGLSLVVANINGPRQTIVSGGEDEVTRLIAASEGRGIRATRLNVSHAFHSPLMAPAERRFQAALDGLTFRRGRVPVIANATNKYYGEDGASVRETLCSHITDSVRFRGTVERLYESGIRLFVEVGPGSVLSSLVEQILEGRPVTVLASDKSRGDSEAAFLGTLCALFAEGVDIDPSRLTERSAPAPGAAASISPGSADARPPRIVYGGVSVGLPGSFKAAFRDDNFQQLFEGRSLIERLSDDERARMVDLQISKVVKSAAGASFKELTALNEVIQLAGRMGILDMRESFHIEEKDAADMSGAIAAAVAAGYEALRDAQIPLVHEYTRTGGGSMLPERWSLPREMQARTGVIFANGFPMVEPIIAEVSRHLSRRMGQRAREALFELYDALIETVSDKAVRRSLLDWYAAHRAMLDPTPRADEVYRFNYRLMTQIAMQANNRLAKYINARGPNFQINAACSSTVTAVALAESLIRTGKAERMIVIGGDDPTSEHALPYLGAAFLATGACTNHGDPYEAATPFDKRRNGMIMGAGAVGLVIERDDACERRGVAPVAELLGAHAFNAAGHGSQLDIPRYADEMDKFIARMEQVHGVSRREMAEKMVYVSHETYTPPRGGCAEAEAVALQHAFGDAFREIEVANTKGMTGHTMGASIEDAAAAKALQYGQAPPVVNHRVSDPALAGLNLSTGRKRDFTYALRLAAGFGSQGNFILLKRRAEGDARIVDEERYRAWLVGISGNDRPELIERGRILAVADTRPGAVIVDRPEGVVDGFNARRSSLPYFHERQQSVPPERAAAASASDLPAPAVGGTAEAPASPALRGNAARALVLETVAEITGYDASMLTFDMDMEADLGIDTVKQATILATLADRFSLPEISSFKLSEYSTLGDVVGLFEREFKTSETAASTTISPQPPTGPSPGPAQDHGASPPDSDGALLSEVMATVARITGYDLDILDPGMELEADLGIDTVKQATIVATLAESLGLSEEMPIRMSELATISSLADLFAGASVSALPGARDERGGMTAPTAPAAAPATDELLRAGDECDRSAQQTRSDAPSSARWTLLDAETALFRSIAEATPYPRGFLSPTLVLPDDLACSEDLEPLEKLLRSRFALPDGWALPRAVTLADLAERLWRLGAAEQGRVDVALGLQVPALVPATAMAGPRQAVRGARVWVLGDEAACVAALKQQLEDAGASTASLVFGETGGGVATALTALADAGRPDIVIDLTASPLDRTIHAMGAAELQAAVERAMDMRFEVSQWFSARAWVPSRVLAVTGIDGCFGLGSPDRRVSASALYGLHTGFYKALRREWPKSFVSVLDLSLSDWRDDAAAAWSRIEAELSVGGGGAAVCYANGERHRVVVSDSSWTAISPSGNLGEGEVIVATGGGAGITGRIVRALARRRPVAVALIGRTSLDESGRGLLAAAEEVRSAIKIQLREALAEGGERVTPVMVEKAFSALSRSAEIFDTIDALEAWGSKARYYTADVRDEDAIQRALSDVRARFGPITTLIHGAGLEISRPLDKKSAAEFREVHSVKSLGAPLLNRLCRDEPLRRIVYLTSISGHLGNAAQIDYAGANAFLDMMARLEDRPGVRAVSLAFSGWEETGMAWRNSYVRENAEAGGLNFIPVDAGAGAAAAVICAPDGPREVVVHRGLGRMVDADQAETDLRPYPLVDWIERRGGAVSAVYRRFSPGRDAFLDQHRLAETPLMPGVGFMEMMAEAAVIVGAPGGGPFVFENLRFSDAFKLHRDDPRDVRLEVEAMAGTQRRYMMTARSPFGLPGQTPTFRSYCAAAVGWTDAAPPAEPVVSSLPDARETTWGAILSAADRRSRNVRFGALFNEARRPVAERQSSVVRWNDTGIDTEVPLPREQVANDAYPLALWRINPAFLDTLHQAGAVLAIELTGHVYLPVGADLFTVWQCPRAETLYRVSARLRHLNEETARYDMVMTGRDGACVATVSGAVFRRMSD